MQRMYASHDRGANEQKRAKTPTATEQAKRLLKWEDKGSLIQTGTLKGAHYELAPDVLERPDDFWALP